MRLTGIRWGIDHTVVPSYCGYDLHLLRNGQPADPVVAGVIFDFERAPADPPGSDDPQYLAAVAATPLLRGTIQATAGGDLVEFQPQFGLIDPAHGLTISNAGAVTVSPNPGKKLSNFLLRVRVTSVEVDPTTGLNITYSLVQRVHLHDALDPTLLRLTPSGLTVRPGGRPVRFGVLAVFDDEVPADLTYHHPTWELLVDSGGALTPAHFTAATNTYDVGGLTMSATTGSLQATGTFPSGVVARCTLPAFNNARTFPEQVLAGPAWNLPVEAEYIAGPGAARRDDVPNILVLPDGFQAGDRDTFFRLVRALVDNLRNSPISQPWRNLLLGDSLNVFAAFVESREAGSTLAYELLLDEAASFGRESFDPGNPGGGPIRTISELIWAVGLPTLADLPAPGVPPQDALAAALAKWNNLYGAYFSQFQANSFFTDLYASWLKLARRGLALETDTAFGVRNGERPRAQGGNESLYGMSILNGLRPQRADLDLLLRSIFVRLPGTTASIGLRWITGSDRRYVVILCAGLPNGGTNRQTEALDERTACIGLGAVVAPVKVARTAETPRLVRVDAGPPSAAPSIATMGTLSHELAHSFECGEEYGGGGAAPRAVPSATRRFPNAVFDVTLHAAAAQPFDFTRSFWGAMPRVRAAGLLAASPVALSATDIRLDLRAGHGAPFAALVASGDLRNGDAMYLRGRPMMRFIRTRTPNTPPDLTLALSPRLEFDSVTGDSVVVRVAGGGAIPAVFNIPQPDDLLSPVLIAARLDRHRQILPLLSPIVAAHMNALVPPTPLNRKVTDLCSGTVVDLDVLAFDKAVVAPAHLPADPRVAAIRAQPKILGLYDGGAGFDCGVYHPSGYCSMRRVTSVEFADKTTSQYRHFRGGAVTSYCHVCQYLIVDICDPTLHAALDDSYSRLYLEPL